MVISLPPEMVDHPAPPHPLLWPGGADGPLFFVLCSPKHSWIWEGGGAGLNFGHGQTPQDFDKNNFKLFLGLHERTRPHLCSPIPWEGCLTTISPLFFSSVFLRSAQLISALGPLSFRPNRFCLRTPSPSLLTLLFTISMQWRIVHSPYLIMSWQGVWPGQSCLHSPGL